MTRRSIGSPFGPFASRMFASASCLRSPACAGMTAWFECALDWISLQPVGHATCSEACALTLAPRMCSAMARAMKRAVIGVPS